MTTTARLPRAVGIPILFVLALIISSCFYDYEKLKGTDAGAAGGGGRGGSSAAGGRGGSSGIAGSGGVAGSVTGTAGTLGAAGTTGAAGTVGVAGTTGAAGRGGTTGSAGTTGAAGTIGAAGTTGTAGRGGTTASAGTTGAAGRGGTTGSAGTIGAAGRGGTTGSAGTTAGTSGTAGAGGTSDLSFGLVLWYKLDDASGTTAADSSGNARNGTLRTVGTGTALFSTTHQVGTGSLNLVASSATVGGYVNIPASLNALGATTEITIAAWVNVTTDRPWTKVFDFNNTSTTGYMFLTTHQAQSTPNAPRFAITTTNNSQEQQISSPFSLSINAWHHLVVVLGPGSIYTGTLYIDGAAAGTNTSMNLRPSSLGNTVNNWIGRSSFAADAYFHGYVDDFRVYNRALSAAEIVALYAVR